MMRSLFALLLLLLFILISASAYSATYGTCTDGTDCYCDQVADIGSDLYDANVLLCEDWESLNLRTNTGYGNGAPNYGPPYDETGSSTSPCPHFRGWNSYYFKKYGNGGGAFLFSDGEPLSPTYGSPCSCTGGAQCVENKLWTAGDIWNANSYDPMLGVVSADGDFDDEVADVIPPINTSTGGDGVFDGNASLFYRIPAGGTNGKAGDQYSLGGVKHIGITMAIAFSDNMIDAGLGRSSVDGTWKFDEFDCSQGNCGNGLVGFGESSDRAPTNVHTMFPFYGFYSNTTTGNNCTNATASLVEHLGSVRTCNASQFVWGGDSGESAYTWDGSWGVSEWGCLRAEHDFSTQSNGFLKMWVQTADLEETLVVHISGINADYIDAWSQGAGISWWWPNAYANQNQGLGGTATTETAFRYTDNIHVTNGTPVSCAAIGFNSQTPLPEYPGISISYLSALFGLLGLLGTGLFFAATRVRGLSWQN